MPEDVAQRDRRIDAVAEMRRLEDGAMQEAVTPRQRRIERPLRIRHVAAQRSEPGLGVAREQLEHRALRGAPPFRIRTKLGLGRDL